MKQYLLFAILSGYLLTGCSATKDPVPPQPLYKVSESQKSKIYQTTMGKLALSTKEDSRYQRIALETAENKAWFRSLTYRLWNREITKQAFVREGLKQYPERRYEFEFIAEGLNLQQ
ncbi:hypothetical protein [Sulfurovum sp.]|uniref:hypothetical protein n=1 Tax=Sulfurovum sp. TaxID=1969726 RepID=UPI002A36F35F|nr:hypothetical protein [Sulfurovum sp.]MDY0402233.1 hypothetical protein [Sulfurovum sp.]